MNKKIVIKYSIIKKISLIYILLPLACFFFGWLKLYIALIAFIALTICFIFSNNNAEDETKKLELSFGLLITLFLITFLFSFFCGIGRFWAQSKDYPWRNAIFRDIILRDWPVIYDKYEGALVYYIGLWLPPALIGKLASFLGANADLSFVFGNAALLIYVSIGLFILFLLLILYFNPDNIKTVFLVIFAFIFFSGMDVVASIEPLGANNYHLEWWAREYQYSSFTTCMCWVFNQSLISWICVALILNEKTIKNFVLIGMACLFSGPLPFVGLFVYCVSIGFNKLLYSIKNKEKTFFKDFFSISNVLSTLIIFPIIGLYLLSNTVISSSGGVGIANAVIKTDYTLAYKIWTYIKFILLEFGVYSILIIKKYKKDYLYYITIISLFIFPFIRIGGSSDFTMRASIPAIFMMYIFCIKYLLEEKKEYREVLSLTKKENKNDIGYSLNIKQRLFRYSYILLIICLIFGAATPMVEFIRGFRQVYMRGINDPVTDCIYTLGGDGPYSNSINEEDGTSFYNFISNDLEGNVFFKYLSKR